MRCSLLLSLTPLLVTGPVAAHGGAPAALAVLVLDEEGPRSVRLSEGLAQRTREGFRFVCAEAWGGDVFAPTSTLPSGEVIVAGSELVLVDSAGRATPHPERVGTALALARTQDALYGLFLDNARRELRRIEATGTELLYSSDEPFTLLAARTDSISLMHFAQHTAVVQHLSPQGEVRERVTWWAQSAFAYAELRATGDQLYVLAWGNTRPWVTLGRVTMQAYEPLREARSTIAGPLALPGATLVAIDGILEPLEAGAGELVQGGGAVNCLDSVEGRAYACVSEGLKELDVEGVGKPLFRLAALRDPDYELMPASLRADCAFRWRDVREHVAMLPGAADFDDAGVATTASTDGEDASSGGEEDAGTTETAAVNTVPACALRAAAKSGADRQPLLLTFAALALLRVLRLRLSGSSSARPGS
jgi:hypothetical protein